MAFNNILIKQIDELIIFYSQNRPTTGVSISENSALSEVIKTKNELIKENQYMILNSSEYEKIIKDQSIINNQLETSGLNNKMKLILPLLFIFIYLVGFSFNNLYKKQLERINS